MGISSYKKTLLKDDSTHKTQLHFPLIKGVYPKCPIMQYLCMGNLMMCWRVVEFCKEPHYVLQSTVQYYQWWSCNYQQKQFATAEFISTSLKCNDSWKKQLCPLIQWRSQTGFVDSCNLYIDSHRQSDIQIQICLVRNWSSNLKLLSYPSCSCIFNHTLWDSQNFFWLAAPFTSYSHWLWLPILAAILYIV